LNWINNVVRPKIRGFLTTRREPPEDFWHKCPACGQMTDKKALDDNKFVFPCCGHHGRMNAMDRLTDLFDDGKVKLVAIKDPPPDPLKFRDSKKYVDRIKDAKAGTALPCAVVVGEGTVEGREVVAAAHDARFLSGSLATAEGGAIVAGMLRAVDLQAPFILFAASGGARMQEGILSLMQMPRTTIAVQRLREARLPYIVVLTDPTTGGVTASYAMLGDVQVAEPNALICFAGPRVIQQTIREQLPEGFQRAEYLLAHGMIDMIVHRHKLRETLARLVRLLAPPVGIAKSKLNGVHAPGANGATLNNAANGATLNTAANGAALHGAANGAASNSGANGAALHGPANGSAVHGRANGHDPTRTVHAEPVAEAERLDPVKLAAKTAAKAADPADRVGQPKALPPGKA
jgi:acetyl-CoA carboxylase carboxyl transferase subunit beta